MIHILSPAKTLEFDFQPVSQEFTIPEDLDKSEQIVKKLRSFSKSQLGKLMSISESLSELNVQRFVDWDAQFTKDKAGIALQAFRGDVYQGLDADSFTAEDADYAQKHMRILSGLHGMLRPLDLMKPYRLEMGTSVNIGRRKNLYHFWQERVTQRLKEDLKTQESNILINLASDEYAKVVDMSTLDTEIIKPVFKDFKNGKFKVISFFAKKARGFMSAFIIKNRIDQIEGLKDFDIDGYSFNDELSKDREWVFTRNNEK